MDGAQNSTERGDAERVETIVIGAGQAGLATGHHLQRRGRPFVILDGNDRVGDEWRQQWDTLRLYTPVKYDGLPGMPFPGSPWTYPLKDEVADYLEAYAARFDLPVRTGTRVERVGVSDGGYVVVANGRRIEADNVVVATGTFGRKPVIPEVAADLDPGIRQMHSSDYRRPEQLQDGPVLVVGASHSGTDVAYEVAESHPTILCGPDRGQIPIRLNSHMVRFAFPVMIFMARHVITRRTPIGRREMNEVRFHGGPMLRVKREDLRQRGVERLQPRVTGARDGQPVLADGQALDVANVIWCTGFRQVFDWIDAPVIGPDGWPREYRGVVDDAPGLFFCGLSFQYAFSSMVLPGVGRDAAYLAERIAARAGTGSPAPSEPHAA
ncbi:MAG: NAD(P)-binding domain-containing protein [Lapillicoccus sp.]